MYTHLSILDYYDGSSFDIWIFDAKKITIVPQSKATPASILRLIDHIYQSFAGDFKVIDALTNEILLECD